MVAPTVYDSFSRQVGSGWGTADDGRVWTLSAPSDKLFLWGVNEGGGTNATNLHGQGTTWVLPSQFPSYANVGVSDFNHAEAEVLTLLTWSSPTVTPPPPEPTTFFGPVLRKQDNTYYVCHLQGGVNKVSIGVVRNGAYTSLVSTNMNLYRDRRYWVRFLATDTTLYARVWEYGTVEPTLWTQSVNYPALPDLPISGTVGFEWRATASNHTVDVASFQAWTRYELPSFATPITDNFDRAIDHEGWGHNAAGQEWEGTVLHNPRVYVDAPYSDSGSLSISGIDTNGAYIRTHDPSRPRLAICGPNMTGAVEHLVTMSVDGVDANAYVGVRGNISIDAGTVNYTGYALRIRRGATSVSLWKKTSFVGSLTEITPTTSETITAIGTGVYRVRFRASGTTLSARIWLDGTTEPSTWTITATDSSLTSGRPFFNLQPVAGGDLEYLWVFEHSYYLVDSSTNATTTGTPTLFGTASDNTINFTVPWTNDDNSNNSLVAHYKKSTSHTWILGTGLITRNSGPKNFNVFFTGLLEPLTTYDFQFTFSDPDLVTGTNPVTMQATTTGTKVVVGDLSIVTMGSSSITVRGTYENDTNNNSTATLDYRVSSRIDQVVNDSLTGAANTTLQNHVPDVGGGWIKHASFPDTVDTDFVLYSGFTYFRGKSPSNAVVYYNNTAPPQTRYDVEAQVTMRVDNGMIGVAGRINAAAQTYYAAEYEAGVWKLQKYVAGAVTTLASYAINLELEHTYHIRLSLNDDFKIVFLDDIEIIRSNDNVINTIGYAGIVAKSASVTTAFGGFSLDNILVTWRTDAEAWTTGLTMTADRANKWFTREVTGLAVNAVYEFRVTWADADGTIGVHPKSIVSELVGNALLLSSINATMQTTSAVVEVFYLFDNNNNSELTFQYRSLHELLWTTVPTTRVLIDRAAKKFTTIIVGLRAGTSYEFRGVATDINGIAEGTSDTVSGLFSTKNITTESEKQSKHFIWKVYNSRGVYITTWGDAGDPTFKYYENGGVSDLAVTLARSVNDIARPSSGIAQLNRVDVWCLDPSSSGFGVNQVIDPEFELGAWTLGANAIETDGTGPDGSRALTITAAGGLTYATRSTAIFLFRQTIEDLTQPVPYVATAVARAIGGKVVLYLEAYNNDNTKIDTSNDLAETVGSDWQTLRLEYTPPSGTAYLRVVIENDGNGTMYVDKVALKPKELLVYRGRIESYTPTIDQDGERIDIQILGLVSLLSDDYIDFLQFVAVQPANDATAGRPNLGPRDPADMLRIAIDRARQQNPEFRLYYNADSIKNVGEARQYTFRDQQLRAVFDKIRSLCPPDWHYFIEPDGLVVLRGPQHASTHILRVGVEVMSLSVERSVRNLKNFIHVKGRQDEDFSEPDGFGSIHHITFNQASIDQYGKRMLFIRDANITDPETAAFVAEGRLAEYNREEQRAQCYVPDDKSIVFTGGALRGFDSEVFRPGDSVAILDPLTGARDSYWDQMVWDTDTWDTTQTFAALPSYVPIKVLQYEPYGARLELSVRQPSSVSDYGRLYRWLQLQNNEIE